MEWLIGKRKNESTIYLWPTATFHRVKKILRQGRRCRWHPRWIPGLLTSSSDPPPLLPSTRTALPKMTYWRGLPGPSPPPRTLKAIAKEQGPMHSAPSPSEEQKQRRWRCFLYIDYLIGNACMVVAWLIQETTRSQRWDQENSSLRFIAADVDADHWSSGLGTPF